MILAGAESARAGGPLLGLLEGRTGQQRVVAVTIAAALGWEVRLLAKEAPLYLWHRRR